jgi:hypothetical protein
MYCMPPPKSITSTTKEYSETTKCYYKTYTNVNDVSSFDVEFDFAMCGYNEKGNAYCNERRGDDLYQKYLSIFKPILTAGNLECQKHDGFGSFRGGQCADLVDRFGKQYQDLYHKLFFAGYLKTFTSEISDTMRTALVKQNPSCVKQDITFTYWLKDGLTALTKASY